MVPSLKAVLIMDPGNSVSQTPKAAEVKELHKDKPGGNGNVSKSG